MKETPLLLKAEMVIPALADLKTQTRRVSGLDAINEFPDRWHVIQTGHNKGAFAAKFQHGRRDLIIPCPYGMTGDRLWARETHKFVETKDGITIIYRADNACHGVQDNAGVLMAKDLGKWRPSIFMFRWASRLTLEITDIRIQRLQDISEGDAVAEGAVPPPTELYPLINRPYKCHRAFVNLWDSINAKRGYPWKLNPWLWAITFKRITA